MSDQPVGVLCVDDNEMMAEALKRWLSRDAGLRWVGWRPSAEGLEQTVAELSPQVVVMDVDMPGPNPFEIIRSLARTSPNTLVLMLSGFLRKEYVLSALDAGAMVYLSKERSPQEIADAIRRVARGEMVLCTGAAALATAG
jgi:two-component system NarL family response regulator